MAWMIQSAGEEIDLAGGRVKASVPEPTASLSDQADGLLRVTIEGEPPFVADLAPDDDLRDRAAASVRGLAQDHGRSSGILRAEAVVGGWRFEATVEPAQRASLRARIQRAAAGAHHGEQAVRAPLPGRVLRVFVAVGDPIEPGGRLCSIEAMKMENMILAHRAGTIQRVCVEPGVLVEQGDELALIGQAEG